MCPKWRCGRNAYPPILRSPIRRFFAHLGEAIWRPQVESDRTRADTIGADILRGFAILMVVAFHAFGPTWGYYVPWSGWVRDFSAAPSQAILWMYPITFGW